MAHTCPKCYQRCHCNGDIDDCIDLCDGGADHCLHWGDDLGDDLDEEEYGCCFPGECCMPGDHFPSECFTPEMAEALHDKAADL